MEGFSIRKISSTSWFLYAVQLSSKMEALCNLYLELVEIEKQVPLHTCLLFNVIITLWMSNIHPFKVHSCRVSTCIPVMYMGARMWYLWHVSIYRDVKSYNSTLWGYIWNVDVSPGWQIQFRQVVIKPIHSAPAVTSFVSAWDFQAALRMSGFQLQCHWIDKKYSTYMKWQHGLSDSVLNFSRQTYDGIGFIKWPNSDLKSGDLFAYYGRTSLLPEDVI